MLGHVGGRAAVLAAEGETLEEAQGDEDDRRRDAERRVAGEQADDEGRAAHQEDGDEEGVLAADQVAEPAEHDGAEGADEEAGREGEEGEDERGGLVHRHEEVLGDDRGQRAIQVEVVPLKHRTERRSKNNFAFSSGHRRCFN